MPTFDVSIHDVAVDLRPDTISPHVPAVISGVGGGCCRWRSVVGRAVPSVGATRAGRSSRNAKGCPMNRAGPLVSAEHANPSGPSGARLASPVRVTLATGLGHDIDGAWWPRTGRISRELPQLVSVLVARLGPIVDINVNWSVLQSQPDLNLHCWRGIHQHVMAVTGRDAKANLLIVPHRTATALAVLVLRQAAGLPIYAAHRDSRAFQTADSIVRLARGETI